MVQKLSTPLEQAAVGPHIRHPNPHPQYGLGVTPASGTPSAEEVDDAGAVGVSTEYARADHVHPMPGLATDTEPGFMSAADKAAIAGVGANPVVSPLDGALLDIDNGTLVWDVETYEQVMA